MRGSKVVQEGTGSTGWLPLSDRESNFAVSVQVACRDASWRIEGTLNAEALRDGDTVQDTEVFDIASGTGKGFESFSSPVEAVRLVVEEAASEDPVTARVLQSG